MESSHQARKIIGRILALLALAMLGGGFWAHYHSTIVRHLSTRESTPFRLAIFTNPAMLFTYHSDTHKVQVLLSNKKCTMDKQELCFDTPYDRFFIPQENVQNTYWTQFKDNLTQWRFTPWIAGDYFRAYVNALVQKRTNLRPSEFILLSKELIELTSTDFAVSYPSTKKKGAKKQATAPEEKILEKPEVSLPNATSDAKPLVVEVLNASGKKGLALAVTQYLREQNAKGLLRIDVLQYDNYPTPQDTSFVVDYSGKLVQVTQASRALGITGEIRSEKSNTAICDTRIVLGKDFKMPL